MQNSKEKNMEKRIIDEKKKKEVQGFTTKVILAVTAVIAVYVVYALITKNLNIVVFEVLLGIFVVSYVVLNDIVEPKRLGMFENMTIGQRSGFMKILALDVIGIGALLYWIVGMGSKDNTSGSIFPLLIYILTVQFKRKLRPEFEGIEESLENGKEEPVEEALAMEEKNDD